MTERRCRGWVHVHAWGSDQTHINVTINGVARSDAESHQVYWVDLPDLASSVDNLTIQRGVEFVNGAGAFGATVAIKLLDSTRRPVAVVSLAAPSALRSMAQWSTGETGSGFYMEAGPRLSMATWTSQW